MHIDESALGWILFSPLLGLMAYGAFYFARDYLRWHRGDEHLRWRHEDRWLDE